ncbi:MAG: hydrogenase nickel incorporation protein HypB [Desulfobacteraceae bacterium]|nr:hydrogenase nickel incorporation protein HypB [Desulfobacteraceae bacterium]MCF8094068.1 hydrogenase nickel incorporation protein HypB [Desulfobacteraceae bacterium]
MEGIKLFEVREDILSDNDAAAQQLRDKLRRDKTFVINLMSSPGAGKTSLLLKTAAAIGGDLKIGVIEADIDSTVDAEKIRNAGIEAVQLRTGGFCHLDAAMVKTGLEGIGSQNFDLIFIENVGNLVCPAEFDTGAIRNAMILSVPEGDDKPMKYPLMFSISDVLVINKIDMMELADFETTVLRQRAAELNPDISVFEVSAKTGEGIHGWTDWIKKEIKDFS